MAQPTTRNITGRALRADSMAVSTPAATPERTLPERHDHPTEHHHIPSHYFLAPTLPSPFSGTLEASLDAILEFGAAYPSAMPLMDILRAPVDTSTNWSMSLGQVLYLDTGPLLPGARMLLEDLFFLVTRQLFPEQIAQNRGVMARLYEAKKSQSIRTILRYDMLLEWTKRSQNHCIVVESRQITNTNAPPSSEAVADYAEVYPGRMPRMENVWATLIAAPTLGWGAHKRAEAMKHHVTGLDELLLFTDEEVEGWSAIKLFQKTVQVLLQWQWLRANTERLEEMEVQGWVDLEGRADENEWVRDGK